MSKSASVITSLVLVCTSAFGGEVWENPEVNCSILTEQIHRAESMLHNDLGRVTPEQETQYRAEQQNVLDAYRAKCVAWYESVKESRRREALPGVRLGMTAKQVIEKSSWGKPNEINETVTKHGVHEQWVYSGGYLYFEDGKLTSFQTKR